MELETSDVNTFQELYKSNFGIQLDEGTAKATAQHLIQIMQLVYKPITKDEYDKLNGNYNVKTEQESRL